MREAIKLPPFGEGVAAAEITAWLVAVGDRVTRGQDLLEVQTSKAALTVAAPSDGVVVEQIAEIDEELPVGAVLGWLEIEAEETAAKEEVEAPAASTTPVAPPTITAPSGETAGTTSIDRLRVPAAAGYLSPRVRYRLQELGMTAHDLGAVVGTGRGGRVTAADVERFAAEIERRNSKPAGPARLAIADAMRRSWTRPLATVARLVDVDPILTHRRTVAGRPNLTVYAVRALARVLKQDDRLAHLLIGRHLVAPPPDMAIGVAVDVNDAVLTPVVSRAHEGSLSDLSGRIDEVLAATRAGRATGDAVRGVATVSNYGSLGLVWATPIPPAEESLLVGVGSVQQVPRWNPQSKAWDRGAEIELTLTFDHRVGDGAAAARCLHQIAKLLEKPADLV